MSEGKQMENDLLLEEQQEDTQEGKFLTFSLGEENTESKSGTSQR